MRRIPPKEKAHHHWNPGQRWHLESSAQTFRASHAHPNLNISGEPFLIEARSPLAWSIALFVHNKAAAAPH